MSEADDDSAMSEERDKLILEWMRSNDSFKNLARHYGKAGKPAKLDAEPGRQEGFDPAGPAWAARPGESGKVEPAPGMEAGEVDPRQEPMLEWLAQNDAFKRLAKSYGRSFPKPTPKG